MTRPTRTRRIVFTLALICLGSPPAHACTASDQLSDLGQSYKDLLRSGSQSGWQTGANRLADTLQNTDAAALGRDLGTEGAPADISRIARLFADASSLVNSTWTDRARHTDRTRENLAYIDRLLKATGCTPPEATTSQPGSDNTDTQEESRQASPKAITTNLIWALTIAALTAALATAAAFALTKIVIPKRQTDRLTRFPAVLPVLVTPKDGTPELIDTADISRGGVRLSWTNPPPEGTPVTIDFSTFEAPAQIIWSNPYFAGARFDALLSDEALARIRNRNNTP